MSAIDLEQQLESLPRQCRELQGAALATTDGLLLCGWGNLRSDAAPAAASGLLESLDHHLGLLAAAPVCEALVWSEDALWYLQRLDHHRHVLILQSLPMTYPAVLRLLARTAGPTLEATLATMHPLAL